MIFVSDERYSKKLNIVALNVSSLTETIAQIPDMKKMSFMLIASWKLAKKLETIANLRTIGINARVDNCICLSIPGDFRNQFADNTMNKTVDNSNVLDAHCR